MKIRILFIFCALILSASGTKEQKGTLKLEIEGLPTQGSIAVALFNSADGFPFNFSKVFRKKNLGLPINSNSLYFRDIPYGAYAVVVKYDEFYVREGTTFAVYNHMTGITTSGEGMDFKGSKFKMNKKDMVVKMKGFTTY